MVSLATEFKASVGNFGRPCLKISNQIKSVRM